MVVVDVNVLVYLLTDSPSRALARRVHEIDPVWRVPPLWRHELLNVLATLTRQQVLDQDGALTLWRNALGLLGSREQQPDMEQALSLAIGQRISAYDAQYVALAIACAVPLISEDKKLQRQLPEQVMSMERFVGLERSPQAS